MTRTAAPTAVPMELLELALCRLDAYRLAFVNGVSAPALSDISGLPSGVRVSAAVSDIKIEFSEKIILEKPIHLLFLTDAANALPPASFRTSIILEEGAGGSVIEEHAGRGGDAYEVDAKTEIVTGKNSALSHTKLVREADLGVHIASLRASLARDSRFTAHSISLGGESVTNDVRVALDGEGADCTLDGLYLASGSQRVANRTVIDHVKPHGASRELYKGVLDGQARAEFNGLIEVRKDAQKTDARVYNKNLLLSENAVIDTKPEFRIAANDVQCKHGATIGQLSQDALFYLRSRGIGAEAARGILVYAFASEMVARLALEPLREALGETLRSRLEGRN